MAHAWPGGVLSRGRPEHGPKMVGRRTPVRVLHARWTPALSSRRSRLVPRRVERRHHGDRDQAVVLVVDDDEQLREFVRVNLEMDGYLVREARSAAEGLAAIEEEPDLVLLDVMMPEVDGFEMLRRMQERHGLGSVPVIMFSGKVDEETAGRAAREGAQAFIGKPFDPQALIESTKQLLSRR